MAAIAKIYDEQETGDMAREYNRNCHLDQEFRCEGGGWSKTWWIGFIETLLSPYRAYIVLRPAYDDQPESRINRLEAGPTDNPSKPYTHFISCTYEVVDDGRITVNYLFIGLNFEEDAFDPDRPGESIYFYTRTPVKQDDTHLLAIKNILGTTPSV